jgi:hypothetical protein
MDGEVARMEEEGVAKMVDYVVAKVVVYMVAKLVVQTVVFPDFPSMWVAQAPLQRGLQ